MIPQASACPRAAVYSSIQVRAAHAPHTYISRPPAVRRENLGYHLLLRRRLRVLGPSGGPAPCGNPLPSKNVSCTARTT